MTALPMRAVVAPAVACVVAAPASARAAKHCGADGREGCRVKQTMILSTAKHSSCASGDGYGGAAFPRGLLQAVWLFLVEERVHIYIPFEQS